MLDLKESLYITRMMKRSVHTIYAIPAAVSVPISLLSQPISCPRYLNGERLVEIQASGMLFFNLLMTVILYCILIFNRSECHGAYGDQTHIDGEEPQSGTDFYGLGIDATSECRVNFEC